MRIRVVLSLGLFLTLACASSQRASATRAAADGQASFTATSPPPAAPAKSLRLPEFAAPLDPGAFATGRAAALRKSLGSRTKFMLVLGPALSGLDWEKRVHGLVSALNPSARVLARGEEALKPMMKERGELPAFTLPAPGPPDVFGHPTVIPREYFLQTEWLGQARKFHGAEVGLWIDTVALEPQREQAFRQRTMGGCKAALDEIASSVAEERATLQPFAQWMDAALREAFRVEVASVLEEARPALAEFSGPERTRMSFRSEEEYQHHRCGRLQRTAVEGAAQCDGGGCVGQPLFVFDDGVWIGATRSEVPIARDCGERLGRDWVAEIEAAAERAARRVERQVPRAWIERASVIAALAEVGDALGRACAPARGRTDPLELEVAQKKLREIVSVLSPVSASATNGWQSERVDRFLKGRGPAVQLARYHVASCEAVLAGVQEALRPMTRRRCASRLNRPIAVVAVDIATSETLFFDYFFEEEILCEELPPTGL